MIWKITSAVPSQTLKLRALSDVTDVCLPTARLAELPPAGCRRAFGRLKRSWGWHLQERVVLTVVNVTHPAEKHLVHKFPQDY